MPTTEKFTARRSWSSVHPDTRKATVTVFDADGNEVARAGGARAERASAAIVTRHVHSGDRLKLYGLRADAAAAEKEAHRLETQTVSRGRRYTQLQLVPYTLAVAVPIVDDDDVARRAIEKLHADYAAERAAR